MSYADFLSSKGAKVARRGISTGIVLPDRLFPHQAEATRFLLEIGCGAAFLDTGLGKTAISIVWADNVCRHTGGPVIILTPLAVAHQFVAEGRRFGITVTHVRDMAGVGGTGIYVTNYDRLHLFDTGSFHGVVLDESSILKNFSGKIRNALVDGFRDTPFRLAATATPSPNDHTELGNHAEFLGLMTQNEMLQRWFINDTSTASQEWRLKKHAVGGFWDWVCSWSYCLTRPSDRGHKDEGFILPPLTVHEHVVEVDITDGADGLLFRMPGMGATDIHAEGRRTAESRAKAMASIVHQRADEPWLIWVYTDYEADAVMRHVEGAVEIRGSMPESTKEDRLIGFVDGSIRILVTKPRIAGWGMNFQHCRNIGFVGVSYSYEQWYQAIRRCWRFGQTSEVDVHVFMGATETHIWKAVDLKGAGHRNMKSEMVKAVRRSASLRSETKVGYVAEKKGRMPQWI